MKKAVVLLSGGMDSTTVLHFAKKQGFEIHALSFDYGAKLAIEVEIAKKIAQNAGVKSHKIAKIDLRIFGGSSLLDEDLEVPKFKNISESKISGTPSTYVPARNTIFLAHALALAEVTGATSIFIGVNKMDFENYPDTRPEFIQAFENLAFFAIKPRESDKKVTIETPLINLNKKEIIRLGIDLKIDYSLTMSCYDPSEDMRACGSCQSCQLRLEGFELLGIKDPAAYV